MAVYDITWFLNENDILEIRLNEHWNFVDKFIVVEAGQRHTGLPKPFYFDHERFKPYASKLEYVKFDDFDVEMAKYPELLAREGMAPHHPDWARDGFQNNYPLKKLKELGAKDDDIVFVSCCDEIIHERAFKEAMTRFEDKQSLYLAYEFTTGRPRLDGFRPLFFFDCRYYIYKFNIWAGHNVTVGYITEYSNFSKMTPSDLRAWCLSTHPTIVDGGWHLSYMDNTDGEMVLEKHKSWAHARDATESIFGKMRFDSESKEESLKIMFGEFNPRTPHGTQVVPITPETHPKYLLDNLDKFKDFILKT